MGPISTPSSAPGSSPDPDIKDLAIKDRAHITHERRDALRTEEVRTTMHIAEKQSGKTLDAAHMDLLIASVEPQDDGSNLYLHGSVEKVGVEFRKAQEQAALSVHDAKERTGTEMNTLFDSLRSTKQTLENARNSGIDTKALQQKIESVLRNEAALRKFREQIDNAAFLLMQASAGGKTKGELLNSVTADTSLDPRIHALIKARIPDAGHYAASVDQPFIDSFILQLRKDFLIAFGEIQAEVATTLPIVTTAMIKAGLDQKNIAEDLGRARRDFNYKFGGTDAETILNFAVSGDATTGYMVDMDILEKEMISLGWIEKDDSGSWIGALIARLFTAGTNKRFVMTTKKKNELLLSINTKITPNPPGTSLKFVQERVEQFGILREWALELIQKHEVAGEVEVQKVIDEIKPKLSGFNSNPLALLGEADPTLTKNPTTLTPEQQAALAKVLAAHMQDKLKSDAVAVDTIRNIKPYLSVITLNTNFPSSKGVTAEEVKGLGITFDSFGFLQRPLAPEAELALAMLLRRKQVEKLTGKESVTVPYRELIKEYAADGAMLFGSAFGVWKDWITSLPENVLSTPQDAEILRLYNQKKDLEKILSALAPIGVMNKATNAVDPGSLITGVGTTLARSIVDMQAALDRSAKAGLPTRPARTTDEALAHAAELQEVGRFVLKELRERTCYEKINDPIVRNRSYLLALYFGIEHAKEYIRNPASYELSNPDNIETIRKPEARVLAAKEAGGGLLAPLEKLGLSLDPRAEFIMADTWIPGTLNTITLDCPPGDALKRILRCHTKEGADTIDRLIRVYITRKDEGDITVERANLIVNGIREFLTLQDDDLQLNLDTKSEKRFDPITAINSGYEALKGMIVDGTYAEKALAFALIGGTIYAIRKAWPKHWKLILTGPMLLAANMALKRATGKSGADYLNLHFMGEKHRKGSREQFARRSRLESEFSEVETPAGRAALDTLTDPNNPVPIEQLLLWRKTMEGAGPTLYSNNAPHLPLSRITDEMGEQALGRMSYNERNNEALRLAFLSFRSLCVDVCRARGLGGATLREKEQAGADYIRRFYTSLNPDCCTKCPDPPPVVGLCGVPPNRCYTMFEILTLERPSSSFTKPIETWTEMALSKAGLLAGYAGTKIGDVGTAIERRKFQLEQAAPEWMDWSKENILSGWDSFRNWSIVSSAKSGAELTEDWGATWIFLSKMTKEAGILIKVHGPDSVEYVYDKGADGVKLTKDTALAFYCGLKKIYGTGPLLIGLEEFIAKELNPVPELEFNDSTNVEKFKKDLVALLSEKISTTNLRASLDTWMGNTMLNIEGEANLPSRALKMELLKRSIYSYIIAARLLAIDKNNGNPAIRSPLPVTFRVLNKETYKFDSFTDARLKEFYDHVFTNYDPRRAGILIGQDRALGITLDQAELQPGVIGKAASVLNWFGDSVLWDTAGDYLKGSLAVYLDPIITEAQKTLTPEQALQFRSYVETLLMNVIVEMTLSDTNANVDPLHLTIKRAKDYLEELQTKRGGVPSRILGVPFAEIKDSLKLYDAVPFHSTAVEILRRSPVAGLHLGGGLGISAASSGVPLAPPAAVPGPSGAPSVTPPVIDVSTADINNPADQANLLLALPTSGTQETAIRDKFDTLYDTIKASADRSDESRKMLLNAVVGTSDSYYGISGLVGTYKSDAEDLFLERFKKPSDLQFVVTELTTTSDTVAHARLLNIAKRSLGARLGEAFALAQRNDSQAVSLANEYLQLAQTLDPVAKDRASMLMEYMFCKGDYRTKTFAEYQASVPGMDVSGALPRFTNKVVLQPVAFQALFGALKS